MSTHVVLLLDPMAAAPDYWDAVLAHLGDVPVVHYRRTGATDLDDELPGVVSLLASTGAQRVIAVGASVGGLMARRLATVLALAGVVLVDSAMEDFPGDEPLPEQVIAALHDEVAHNEEGIAVELTHARLHEDRLRGSMAGVPLVVLARGTNDWPVEAQVGTSLAEAWRRGQERLCGLSDRSLLVIAQGSGHHVAQERPELVAAATRHMVAPGEVTAEDLLRTARSAQDIPLRVVGEEDRWAGTDSVPARSSKE